MQRTCGVTGRPISAMPVIAGATRSISRASPRAKIDLHRLPGPRLVLNRNFDAHRVRQFHLVNLWFHAKSKGVEPQLQDLFEFADTFCPIADKPEIEIFSSPGGKGEAEFHRYAAFEVVGVYHAPLDTLFEYTA